MLILQVKLKNEKLIVFLFFSVNIYLIYSDKNGYSFGFMVLVNYNNPAYYLKNIYIYIYIYCVTKIPIITRKDCV